MNIVRRAEVGTVTIALIKSAGGYYITAVDERSQDIAGVRFLSREMAVAERKFDRAAFAERVGQDEECMA